MASVIGREVSIFLTIALRFFMISRPEGSTRSLISLPMLQKITDGWLRSRKNHRLQVALVPFVEIEVVIFRIFGALPLVESFVDHQNT